MGGSLKLFDQRTAVIVAARRTPISTRGGRLADKTVDQLAAPAIEGALADASLATGFTPAIADVILGNCMGPGGNLARLSALAAGLGVAVPGLTIDRQCGSGLSAIIIGGDAVRSGDDRMQLAGGAESASTAPARVMNGIPYERAAFTPAGFPDPQMGPAAQSLAARYGIARERQDAFAARSHRLALAEAERGGFAAELVAVDGMGFDDAPNRRMPELLGRFASLYPTGQGPGTVTAGNSCRISDGAAVVAMLPMHARANTPGLALVAHATVGCDPAEPGIGPVAAITQLLERAGLSMDSIAAFEIVEAFAAQSLAVLYELGLAGESFVDPRVAAGGGALALGHPWGASGAVSVVRLFSRLVRGGAEAGSYGIAAAAIGGGIGVAALFRVVR